MASLYADENFPRPVSEKLRDMGHDVLTCQESGRAGKEIPDEFVLAFAISTKRAVLTINRRHFKRLHREFPNHFGIINCTKNDEFDELAQRIHQVLLAHPVMTGKLLHVYRPG